MTFTTSTTHKWLPLRGHWAHFTDRSQINRKAPITSAHMPDGMTAITLPIDSTGNMTVSCPIDSNDKYGICGPAQCKHVSDMLTYGQGKPGFTEDADNDAALLAQYLKISGGDNGTNEEMLVGPGGVWITGLGGDTAEVVVDHLDVDVTNVALIQYLIDQFYAVCMAWSVPDAFLKGFNTGTVWANAGIPDAANGHYTPLASVHGPGEVVAGTSISGFYELWTWGTYCFVSPAFVASVQPQSFVAFSPQQFNKATGLDSKGRHITTQAAVWQSVGGSPIPASVINAFPPLGPPTPPPSGTVVVPNVTGFTWSVAEFDIKSADLVAASTGPAGATLVQSQSPLAGTLVATGSTVTCMLVVVSPPTPQPKPLFSVTLNRSVPANGVVMIRVPVVVPAGKYNWTKNTSSLSLEDEDDFTSTSLEPVIALETEI